LQDLLEQIYESPSSMEGPSSVPLGLGLRKEYGQSVLLPSMPVLQQENPFTARSVSPLPVREYEVPPARVSDSNPESSPATKRNRLPQVGRIPRVISRRERQHKPAPSSFSRPFQREDFIHGPPKSDGYSSSIAGGKRPILGLQTDVLPSRPFSSPQSNQAASAPAGPLTSQLVRDYELHPEYVLFTGQDRSRNLETSGPDTVFSTGGRPPSATYPHHTQEDEIWNEYDDLLDRVMSPTSPDAGHPVSLSLNQPAKYATAHQLGQPRPESHLHLEMIQRTKNNPYATQAPPLHLPLSSPARESGPDYRLRRSRIVSALHTSSPLSPSSPFTANEPSLGLADHSSSSADSDQHFKRADNIGSSLLSPDLTPHPVFSKLPEVSHQQSTALLDIAERDREGPAGQSNLRYAALMTSRWLSFGRVLFSPGHEVIESNSNQQVLVIDGLGNDDWSFFCALTYPGAVIHDLKETDVATASRRDPRHGHDLRRAPPNYRRIEVPNLSERFPFPHSHFAVVVVRFPAAMPETILRMAFAECKRVLIPGPIWEL
jgi:hypothetical protein